MALEKDYDYLGKTANYWKITRIITDYVHSKTIVEVRLFWDKAARDADINNFLTYREIKEVSDIDLTTEKCYIEVKKSVKDEEGKETNYFADAKDILEIGQIIEGDLEK